MAEMWVNMGPQHPATHGLWDLMVKVDGETIVDSKPQIGYLHRGIEKLAEYRTFPQIIATSDRLCYVSALSWSILTTTAIEELCDIKPPPRTQYARVILLETQRIISHLVWLAAYCADLGVLTMFLYPVRERELLLDMIQSIAGNRLTYNFPRLGGARVDIPRDFIEKLLGAVNYVENKVRVYEDMLDKSDVFLMRTEDVGILSKEMAIELGCTGPVLRGSGAERDVRFDDPYLVYDALDFEIPTGKQGDSYDRYRVRIEEICQSADIIKQACKDIPEGEWQTRVPKAGPKAPSKTVYIHMEDPRGDAGCMVVGQGSPILYRMKIRTPTFVHLLALPWVLKGCKIADVPTIMGSMDPCMGEVDR